MKVRFPDVPAYSRNKQRTDWLSRGKEQLKNDNGIIIDLSWNDNNITGLAGILLITLQAGLAPNEVYACAPDGGRHD